MKKYFVISLVLLFSGTFSLQSQNLTSKAETSSVSEDKVEIYYFHYSRRCAACITVQNQSKNALEELYPEKVRSGDYVFIDLDIEDSSNAFLMQKLNVQGQSLLVVKGDDQKNITNVAFMYARSNPNRLKEEIRKAVESL